MLMLSAVVMEVVVMVVVVVVVVLLDIFVLAMLPPPAPMFANPAFRSASPPAKRERDEVKRFHAHRQVFTLRVSSEGNPRHF